MKIWFTSDLHFCHDREFIWGPRGFKSVDEMNETIIKNWNSVVNYDDEVYVLGDLMLNDNRAGINLIRRLNGKLHIILGNHDSSERIKEYKKLPNVIDVQYGCFFNFCGYKFYLSHYPTLTANGDDNKPLKRRVINLCGHSHTTDKYADRKLGLIYHVELDAHNCYPVDIDTIVKDLSI